MPTGYCAGRRRRPGWRYVSQCEHGTVHLVWDAIGIHLPASAFVELATHILDTSSQLRAEASPPQTGHCRLQVGRLAIELPLPEFLPFADMVCEALPQVNLLGDWEGCALPRLALPQLHPTPVLN